MDSSIKNSKIYSREWIGKEKLIKNPAAVSLRPESYSDWPNLSV